GRARPRADGARDGARARAEARGCPAPSEGGVRQFHAALARRRQRALLEGGGRRRPRRGGLDAWSCRRGCGFQRGVGARPGGRELPEGVLGAQPHLRRGRVPRERGG
ncbi:unnamed protein product, partial [Prorocentrum cordatum]